MANKKHYYGWFLVALTFYTQFIVQGTVFYSHGILLKPIMQDISGSRLDFGTGFLIYQIVIALMGVLLGQIMSKTSIRSLMLAGSVILSFGFYLLSQANSLSLYYLSFGVIMAIGTAMLAGITNTVLVSNWFDSKRGTALGFSQFGISASGMVMAYSTPFLLAIFGWRATTELFAIIPLVLLAPFVWLFVVDKPEDMALLPDGAKRIIKQTTSHIDSDLNKELLLKNIIQTRNFWLIILIIGFSFTSIGFVIMRLFPYATDQNYSSAQASLLISLMAGLAAFGKPLWGWIGDEINIKLTIIGIALLQALGLFLISTAQTHSMLIMASICFGLGYGGVLPLWGVLLGRVYNRLSFGKIMGLMIPLMLPFQTLGVPFADWIFDQTGSYASAFSTFALLSVSAAVLVIFVKIENVPSNQLNIGYN